MFIMTGNGERRLGLGYGTPPEWGSNTFVWSRQKYSEIPVLDNIRYTSVRNHNSGSSYSNLVLVGRGDKILTTIRQGASKADAMRLYLQGWGDLA